VLPAELMRSIHPPPLAHQRASESKSAAAPPSRPAPVASRPLAAPAPAPAPRAAQAAASQTPRPAAPAAAPAPRAPLTPQQVAANAAAAAAAARQQQLMQDQREVHPFSVLPASTGSAFPL
jgi:hypothetical protein